MGAGVAFVQQGVGASPGYSAIDLRRAESPGLQEGVVEAGSFMVVQRAAGANLSVDIGANTGFALVQGDTVGGQGLYTVPPHSAVINEAIATAHATLPRVDQVILEIQDNVHDASGGNLARLRVLTGTATSGATLDNRTGAAALPGNALLLADVHVPATDTTISNSQIRDRRKWGRGAYALIPRTSGSIAITSVIPTYTDLDAAVLQARIECSGVPLRIRLHGQSGHSVADSNYTFRVLQDGVGSGEFGRHNSTPAGAGVGAIEWLLLPSAGSHVFKPQATVQSGTLTVQSSAATPLHLEFEELARQNTANNTTTTG